MNSWLLLVLESSPEAGQTLIVNYTHRDESPLKRADGLGNSAPSFISASYKMPRLPNEWVDPPASLSLSVASSGDLDISASWDAVTDATSYRVSWGPYTGSDLGGDNGFFVTDTNATITVPNYGKWQVWVQSCRDDPHLLCGQTVTESLTITASSTP